MIEINYENGFLGDSPKDALNPLAVVVNQHVIPFLNDWWSPMNPIPTSEDILALRTEIQTRIAKNKLPEPYEKIGEFLAEISGAIRFNRRNFVNIHPSPFLPAVLASFIVSIQQPNNIVREVSEATWKMEAESIEWISKNLFGIDTDEHGAWGNVVSGGTIANITSMMMARDYTYDKLSRPKKERIGARGIVGRKPGVVIGSAATHYSIKKALWVLGLGSESVVSIPVAYDELMKKENYKEERFVKGIQDQFWKKRILEKIAEDKERSKKELKAFYDGHHEPFSLQPLSSEIYKTVYSCFEFNTPIVGLVLTLGTTDTGTLEKIDDEVIEFLKNEDVYIHGDAASGGFSLVHDEIKDKVNNLNLFDSFTVDPHKMGLLHYPCGVVVFRDKGFKEQIKHEAPYLGPLAPTIEGSRSGAPSAGLWLALKTLGVSGYQNATRAFLDFTKILLAAFKKSSFQVMHKVELNAIAVAPLCRDGEKRSEINDIVLRLRKKVVENGKFMINLDRGIASVKVLDDPSNPDSNAIDIYALRIVITNPLVQNEDAEELIKELEKALMEVRGK